MVAWYAAIVATTILLWDIYKWIKSGPNLKLSASSNMKVYGDPELEGKTYIFLSATNRGNIPTTLLTPGFYYYKNWWSWLRSWRPFRDWKRDGAYIIKNPGTGIDQKYKLPYVILPGTIWQGLANQDAKCEELLKEGLLFFVLYSSHRRKAVMARVRYQIIPESVTSNTENTI